MLDSYRYGFNGKENDNEVQGQGNWQDYGSRLYSPRLGRFPTPDPLIIYKQKYPMLSSYQFASNTPIMADDLDGLEARVRVISTYKTSWAYFDAEGILRSKTIIDKSDNTYPIGNEKYWHYANQEKYGTTGTMTVIEELDGTVRKYAPTITQQTYEKIKNKTYDYLMQKQTELDNWAERTKDQGFIDFADQEVAPRMEKIGAASKKVGLGAAAVGAEPVAAFFYGAGSTIETSATGIHLTKDLIAKKYGIFAVRLGFFIYGQAVGKAITNDKVLDESRKVAADYVIGVGTDALEDKCLDECK